jgi:hypothetical protein
MSKYPLVQILWLISELAARTLDSKRYNEFIKECLDPVKKDLLPRINKPGVGR